ncbi:MAG: SDR family oxidoreductase [Chitinophagaceae bacterium]|nr:SDR family oxidoreductase [Chitinophagaceae bacterium]
MRILFIGATGMLGKPVAKELIKSGLDVTLLARDTDKMQSLFQDTTVTGGDVFEKDSLAQAMKGADTVYCNLSVLQTAKEKDRHTEKEGMTNIIAAAKGTGVKRIVYLSSLVHRYQGMNGFDWWAFRIKQGAIQKIKDSGLSYTIFYPSTFMEAYPHQMIMGSRIAILGDSVMPMWFIAAEDYARQVAASFRLLNNENREYSIQGTEAFTFDQANTIMIQNYTRRKLSVMKAPIGIMKFLGRFSAKFNYAWHICEALNKYPEKFESENTWKELGKPSITLSEFARTA